MAALLLVSAACKLDIEVAIDAKPNGSGTVGVTAILDEEATARMPNLEAQLRVDDLKATGWTVTGPTPIGSTKGGSKTVVQATKGFRTPDEATRVLDEVSGAKGPLSGLRLNRERKPLWWAWTFEGDLDLTGGIERFGDEALRTQLEGTSFGLDAKEVQQAISLQLTVDLPGQVDAKGAKVANGEVVWTPNFDKRRQLSATSRDWAISRTAAGAVAASAFIGFVTLLLLIRRNPKASG
ncbi:MAG: hypothetical protein ACSLFB_04615 [Acidimicrobiales bacterium]